MNSGAELRIDLAEEFLHLARAPIVEAVLEIRTRAQSAWEEKEVTNYFTSALPEYPNAQSQAQMVQEFTFGAAPSAKMQNLGWRGTKMRSSDGQQVVQFNRDSFVFSRLQPYPNWERFFTEASRLWKLHSDLSRPTELQRIGLRFINQIRLPQGESRFEDFIQPAPAPPQGLQLPFLGFTHHDILAVPGHAYAINLVRTIQTPPHTDTYAVILDIDVFTSRSYQFREGILQERMPEMRWLKNKVFFGSITTRAVQLFQ